MEFVELVEFMELLSASKRIDIITKFQPSTEFPKLRY